MKTASKHNDAMVVCYPYLKEISNFQDDASPSEYLKTNEVIIRKALLGVSTNKGKGAVGSFSFTLAGDRNWKAILHKGAWCFIYIKNSPLTGNETSEVDSGLKMVGIIRSIRRMSSTDSEGLRMTRYAVSGEDFHHFLNNPIYLNLNLSGALAKGDQLLSALITLKNDPGLSYPITPRKMADVLFRNMLGQSREVWNSKTKKYEKSNDLFDKLNTNNPVRVPSAVHKRIHGEAKGNPANLYAELLTNHIQDVPGVLVNFQGLSSMSSTFSMISAYSNSAVNETYTEMLPVRDGSNAARLTPGLIMRGMPFASESGKPHSSCVAFTAANELGPNSSTSHPSFYTSRNIDEADILSEDTGLSDSELFNFFFVPPSFSIEQNMNQTALLAAFLSKATRRRLVDEISMNRYGSRIFSGSTNYLIEGKGKGEDNIFLYTEMAVDYFKNLHRYENGALTLTGSNEHIPVGTNVLFTERDWIGHVEQVSHQFGVSPDGNKHFRTQLTLTRIQKKDGTPIDYVDPSSDSDKKRAFKTDRTSSTDYRE